MGRAEQPRRSVSCRSCVSDGFRVDVTARPYRRPMAEPKPLSPCRAWWVRQLHRWDWTFYPAASAGDATVRVRRQVRPSVTPAIRRLQRVGTGRWEGRRPLDHTGRMVLANVSGVPVGYAYAVDHLSGSAGCSLLDDVVVDPSMRNRGIGRTRDCPRWMLTSWLNSTGDSTGSSLRWDYPSNPPRIERVRVHLLVHQRAHEVRVGASKRWRGSRTGWSDAHGPARSRPVLWWK